MKQKQKMIQQDKTKLRFKENSTLAVVSIIIESNA